MSVLIAACLLSVLPAEVEVVQAGWTTRGTVIHASRQHGTFILTCGHKSGPVPVARVPGEVWRAGKLTGRHMRVDRKADLALLWTPTYIPGQAHRGLALAGGCNRGRCCGHAGAVFDVGLRCADGHRMVGLSNLSPSNGMSGAALLDPTGSIVGVCSGATFGTCCFVPRESVERFLQGR